MAKAWKDVIAFEQYQALTTEQKAQAQAQYFNEVVAPQAGHQADQAKQAFYAAYPLPSSEQQVKQAPKEQHGSFLSDLGDAVAETGKGLLQAGVNVANIPASMADAVSSTAAWAGNQIGMGNGTYQPSPLLTTQGLEKDLGLQAGTLTPQTTEGQIFAEALPYLTPVGAGKLVTQAHSLSARAAQGASKLLVENGVGSLAANSGEHDPEKLATDLTAGVVLGGSVNAASHGLGAAYRGIKGSISPEAQQAIKFAEQEGVPLHTTDMTQPQSRIARMAQTFAENIPLTGTSGMRSTQQKARSQLVNNYAARFGEYDPSIVVKSLQEKASKIRQAAGNRIEQVERQLATERVHPIKAINQIDDEIAKMQRLGSVADADTIAKLHAYRHELERGHIDFKLLRDLRTQFRQDVKGDRIHFPTRSEAAIQRVYNAMTGDMHQAVKSRLGSDTVSKLKQADAIWANEADKLKNTRLRNVLSKGELTPEVVNNLLFSNKKSEIQNLYRSIGNGGRAQIRNGIIGKAMEKSGGVPDQFLRQVKMLSNQTGIVFKGKDAAYLKGLTKYLESTKQAARAGVSTPTGQQTIPFILGIFADPVTITLIESYGLLARLHESAGFRNAVLKMAHTPRGSTAFETQLLHAQKAVNAIAQGVKSEVLK